jgi:hypothetical protein
MARRTTTHRARFAPRGGATHAPGSHWKRSPAHSHPPSAHTTSLGSFGRGGTTSTGGGLGMNGTGT